MLEKDLNQVTPHMLLGTIYDMRGQPDLSEKHYRKALAINPDFAPAANNLAYLLVTQDKDLDLALGLAQKAKETLSDDPGVMDTLGWIYYKKGLIDSAISELRSSAEKMPDNAIVRYHLGLAYAKKGDTTLAKKELQAALTLEKDFDGSDNARKVLSSL